MEDADECRRSICVMSTEVSGNEHAKEGFGTVTACASTGLAIKISSISPECCKLISRDKFRMERLWLLADLDSLDRMDDFDPWSKQDTKGSSVDCDLAFFFFLLGMNVLTKWFYRAKERISIRIEQSKGSAFKNNLRFCFGKFHGRGVYTKEAGIGSHVLILCSRHRMAQPWKQASPLPHQLRRPSPLRVRMCPCTIGFS